MRSSATLAAALAWFVVTTMACRTLKTEEGAVVLETSNRNFDDELGMRPGIGYDTISADVRGVCVDFDRIDDSGAAQTANYYAFLVENHSQLSALLKISSESQVKSAMSDSNDPTSAKTRFGLGTTFSINKYSVYMMVVASIRNQTATLYNPRIKQDVKAEMEADANGGYDRFRQRCGDNFMVGYATGGEFVGVIEISTENEETKASIKSQAKDVQQQIYSSLGTMAGQIKSVTKDKAIRIWTYQRGGAGAAQVGMVTTTDEMMTRMTQLADSVKVGNNPAPISATMSDYLTLNFTMPQTMIEQAQKARDVVDQLAATHSQLLDVQANIDFVLSNVNAFVGVDANVLKQFDAAKAEIDRGMKRIYDAGQKCAKSHAFCAVPTDLKVPAVTLPQRRTSLATLTSAKLRVEPTTSYLNGDKLYDGWFNPPECYMTLLAGKNHNNAGVTMTLRRTNTVYGVEACSRLNERMEPSVAAVKEAFNKLGVAPENGWIRVQVWEDDTSYDDLIGETDFWYRDLSRGAVVRQISNGSIIMDIGFDLVQ